MLPALHKALLQLFPFVVAVVFHEFAHGWMAKRFGDETAFRSGRMTLNPMPHIDPVGTLALPFFCFWMGFPILLGWAKPVPIDPRNFTRPRAGLFWVSFAGPLMNILLAVASAVLLVVFLGFVPASFELRDPMASLFQVSVFVNIVLAAFNLLPIPPLDGSKMLLSTLKGDLAYRYESLEPYGFWIIMGLAVTGLLRYALEPVVGLGMGLISGVAMLLSAGLGL